MDYFDLTMLIAYYACRFEDLEREETKNVIFKYNNSSSCEMIK